MNNENCIDGFPQMSIVKSREAVIASVCKNLARDLKSINPEIYVLYFSLGDMPMIFHKINDVVESNFACGKMAFACTGECAVEWNSEPVIAIDLEFSSRDIIAFFRLFFSGSEPSVELHHISFQGSGADPIANTEMLERELKLARL